METTPYTYWSYWKLLDEALLDLCYRYSDTQISLLIFESKPLGFCMTEFELWGFLHSSDEQVSLKLMYECLWNVLFYQETWQGFKFNFGVTKSSTIELHDHK